MSTYKQIFCLALVALGFTSIGPAAPVARAEHGRPTQLCIIWHRPSPLLRPTPRRPIILTPPCRLWRDPRIPEPVMEFL